MFYGFAPLEGSLFIMDLDGDIDVFNVYAKCLKIDINTSMFWHCHLGRIGKKHAQKLHIDGLLESYDPEIFDTCEA
jgi:hypothetical protein